MKRLEIPEAVVVGHSMGALVAQRFALDFPERVAGLVLIGTFRTQAENAEMLEMIASLDRMKDPMDIELVRSFQASTLAQPVPDEFFATVVAQGARLPLSVWRSALKEIAAYDDFAELSGISAPTILCWGECDGFSTSERQQEIARAIPGAEFRVYAGAGHGLHSEEPKRFAAELADFVSALAKRRPKARARA